VKSLPLKLGLLVVLVFSVVIATCLLWTPVKGILQPQDEESRTFSGLHASSRGVISVKKIEKTPEKADIPAV
jgi:hypothetical protein